MIFYMLFYGWETKWKRRIRLGFRNAKKIINVLWNTGFLCIGSVISKCEHTNRKIQQHYIDRPYVPFFLQCQSGIWYEWETMNKYSSMLLAIMHHKLVNVVKTSKWLDK